MSFGHDIAALVADFERGLLARHSSWPRIKLSEVADVFNGFPYESASFNEANGMPLLRIRDILPGRTETRYSGRLDDPRMFKVRNGDLVVGMDGDFNARIWQGGEALLNQRVCLIRTREEMYSQKFLGYLLPGYLKLINDHTSSITVKHLSSRTLQDAPLPFPPLAEQCKIAARIDVLFAEITEGEAALAEARNGLETFRRALLKAAAAGELTKVWRATNQVKSSGSEIIANLRSRYPNVSPTKAGWKPKEGLQPLPPGWTWSAIEEAGEVQLGRQRAPQHHSGDHMRPYLRVANVLEDRLDLSDVKSMNFTPEEFLTFELHSGDILLNEGQAPDLLGRPAMYRGEIPECCFQKTLLRFRAKQGILPEYALIVFRHYMHSGRFKRESRITTNIGHLTQVRFVVMEFPVPPEAEQRAIVDLFHQKEGAASDVLAMLDAEAADAARLKQSILKSAFEGSLVPQDSTDEPATALLAGGADPPVSPPKSPGARKRRPVGAS
jgi:type I restriction enzyme S subunit